MDETEIRHVLEAALLASHKPLSVDKLVELFAAKAPEVDKGIVRDALTALGEEYAERGIEVAEVASGFRIQVRSRMTSWLHPLWEERPPRYSRALLETLALIAYRQPVTRGEIEEVRGVAVNSNIIRSMLERDWIRVVGHRDVPGKPEMFGTTKQFLDYFGLRSIDQLPVLAEIREQGPEDFPQADFLEGLESQAPEVAHADMNTDASGPEDQPSGAPGDGPNAESDGEPGDDPDSEPNAEPVAESSDEARSELKAEPADEQGAELSGELGDEPVELAVQERLADSQITESSEPV